MSHGYYCCYVLLLCVVAMQCVGAEHVHVASRMTATSKCPSTRSDMVVILGEVAKFQLPPHAPVQSQLLTVS